MGADDANEGALPGECIEHLWQLAGVTFADDGAHTDYTCPRCEGALVVPPGGTHPETV